MSKINPLKFLKQNSPCRIYGHKLVKANTSVDPPLVEDKPAVLFQCVVCKKCFCHYEGRWIELNMKESSDPSRIHPIP